MPQTRQKTIARPPSRIAPPIPPTTPPTIDLLFDERPELPDPPLFALSPGLPEDEAKAAAITRLDVETELKVTLPLVEIIVVTIFCVTLPVGVVLDDVVWEDPSFDVEDFDSSEVLDFARASVGDDVVELVFAAPWNEVDVVSEDVVESVVICASSDWEVEMDGELAKGLAKAVVVDVLFSWRYCRFSATERMAQTRRRAKLRRNMLKPPNA